eukprot:9276855-Karenia_brevis.AAC.1
MYHSQKQIESIILLDAVPCLSIRADLRDDEPSIVFDPGFDAVAAGIDKEVLGQRFTAVTAPCRKVDTST